MGSTATALFRTMGAISVASSTVVAGTCLAFKSLRRSFFTRIILMIALSDVGLSTAAILGFPSGERESCALQGFLFVFFTRANWMWTTMLVFQMYRFIIHNRAFFSEKIMHAIVWSLSTLLTFLPLIHAQFGRASSYSSGEMCVYTSSEATWLHAWLMITFMVTLFLCVFVMLYFISSIYWKYRNTDDPTMGLQIFDLVKSLYLYPVILLSTWGVIDTINTVYQFSSPSSPSVQSVILDIAITFSLSNGFWVSVVFFYKSPEARRRWLHLLLNKELDSLVESLDFDETSFGNDGLTSSFTAAQTTSEIWRGSSFDDAL
jgi:hypothetical protein